MWGTVDVEVHHGGMFESVHVLNYKGGENVVHDEEEDLFGLTALTEIPIDDSVENHGKEVNVNGEEADDEDNRDFRESDEEEEDDLFFPHPKLNKEVDDEIRTWMGKQLGKDFENIRLDAEDEQVSEYEESDGFMSLSESDGEEGKTKKKRYPEFNEYTDMVGNINLELGMIFSTSKVFKAALKEFSIKAGKDYSYKHNEADRVSAVCKKEKAGCGWYILASYTPDRKGFQIKTYKPVHSCDKHVRITKVDYKWLANKYIDLIRDIPEIRLEAFQGIVRTHHDLIVSRSQCYRAKRLALKMIQGTQLEQYKMLWDYSHALLKWNPGSSVHIQVDDNHVFQRMYVCFEACKKGLLNGCRKIIGLDACHIKAGWFGQLLCAIGIDANDNMFPVAYALYEGETTDSWNWFVDYLLEDIGSVEQHGWTFISDQQKGLVDAVLNVVKDEDSRYCVRHLHENFKKIYKGKVLKDAMWQCARASTEAEFNKAMEDMMGLSKEGKEAHDWLKKKKVYKWSRHAFSTRVKSDMLLNNISECFNSYILQARDKPIITMMETIRRMLMKRFHLKFEGMKKLTNPICPRIQKKLEVNKRMSMHCSPHLGKRSKVEVDHFYTGKHVVDMDERTCTCRKWDLSGIPCGHACAAIYFHHLQPEDFVHKCYHRDTFLAIYEPTLHPMLGPQEWPKTNLHPITPPILKRKQGKPKRQRKRQEEEPPRDQNKLSKEGTIISCGICKEEGHNARTCKKPITDPKRAAQLKMKAEKAAARRAAKRATKASTIAQGGASQSAPTSQVAGAVKRAAKRAAKASTSVQGGASQTAPTSQAAGASQAAPTSQAPGSLTSQIDVGVGSQPRNKQQCTIRSKLGVRRHQGRTVGGKTTVTLSSFGDGNGVFSTRAGGNSQSKSSVGVMQGQ